MCTDSRSLLAGQCFLALKGDNFDANEFIGEALERGADLVISNNDKWSTDEKVIVVEDTMECLQKLATYHRRQLNIPILALTGSNGKTTTKELVARLVRKVYQLGVTEGNLNNHIGVPLTLLSFGADLDFGIVEMGANHQKEIEALCNIALPDEGFITNIGMAHLEGFGGLEGVKNGKGELFEHLKDHEKRIYVNQSDPDLVDLSGGYQNVVRFSDSWVPYNGEVLEVMPLKGHEFCSLQVRSKRGKTDVVTSLVGDYNYRNILVALAVAGQHGVPLEEALEELQGFEIDLRRSQLKMIDGINYVLDCYNANPTSMMYALSNFLDKNTDEVKFVILGDMKELGDYSCEAHTEVIELLKSRNLSNAILIGPEFGKVIQGDDFSHFPDVNQARPYWKKIKRPGMRVLVKGSRSMTLERILD